MFDKSKIKIVKKSEASTIKPKKVKKVSSRAAAREMVSNVTGWVSEIKQRKTLETKAAFESLFAPSRLTSES
jgi:hypothetical protein